MLNIVFRYIDCRVYDSEEPCNADYYCQWDVSCRNDEYPGYQQLGSELCDLETCVDGANLIDCEFVQYFTGTFDTAQDCRDSCNEDSDCMAFSFFIILSIQRATCVGSRHFKPFVTAEPDPQVAGFCMVFGGFAELESHSPSISPVERIPTLSPITSIPSFAPITSQPSIHPITQSPSITPSFTPSSAPSPFPSILPSKLPSEAPSATQPSPSPTSPTRTPSKTPSRLPSRRPSRTPSLRPTTPDPTLRPSDNPTQRPRTLFVEHQIVGMTSFTTEQREHWVTICADTLDVSRSQVYLYSIQTFYYDFSRRMLVEVMNVTGQVIYSDVQAYLNMVAQLESELGGGSLNSKMQDAMLAGESIYFGIAGKSGIYITTLTPTVAPVTPAPTTGICATCNMFGIVNDQCAQQINDLCNAGFVSLQLCEACIPVDDEQCLRLVRAECGVTTTTLAPTDAPTLTPTTSTTTIADAAIALVDEASSDVSQLQTILIILICIFLLFTAAGVVFVVYRSKYQDTHFFGVDAPVVETYPSPKHVTFTDTIPDNMSDTTATTMPPDFSTLSRSELRNEMARMEARLLDVDEEIRFGKLKNDPAIDNYILELYKEKKRLGIAIRALVTLLHNLPPVTPSATTTTMGMLTPQSGLSSFAFPSISDDDLLGLTPISRTTDASSMTGHLTDTSPDSLLGAPSSMRKRDPGFQLDSQYNPGLKDAFEHPSMTFDDKELSKWSNFIRESRQKILELEEAAVHQDPSDDGSDIIDPEDYHDLYRSPPVAYSTKESLFTNHYE